MNWKQTLGYGFGGMAIFTVWPIFNQFVPLILQAGNPLWEAEMSHLGKSVPQMVGFGLSPTLAFFIMTWDNILNMFIQPWVGMKSDQTWTRFGRRKPWLMIGVPIAAVGLVLIPSARSLVVILLFIFVTNLGMALFRAPCAAWLGDLFSPEERSKVRGIGGMMSGLAAVVSVVIGGLLFERLGPTAPFAFGAVVLITSATIAFALVLEPHNKMAASTGQTRLKDTFRFLWQTEGRGGIWLLVTIFLSFMVLESIQAGLSSFAVFVLGQPPGQAVRFIAVLALALIVFAFPSGLIGTRIGPQRAIQIGLAGVVLTAGIGFWVIQSVVDLAVVLFVLGFFISLIAVNDLPMLYRLGDENQIGANTGIYFMATQSAAILGPTLAGFIIEVSGNYRMLFAFVALCAFCAWWVARRVSPL